MTTQAIPLIIHHPPWAARQSPSAHTESSSTVAGKSEETVIVVENGEKVMIAQETAIATPEGQQHHSRCNSVVPPELTSTEGGRERAALATVFGVQEYTQSNTFWERLQQEHALAEEEKKKSASLADAVYHNTHRPVTQQQPKPQQKAQPKPQPQQQHTSYQSMTKRKPVPALPAGLKIETFLPLPDIPNVSKFNDFLIEDEHGMDLMFPASPSSVLLHSFSPPLDHTMTESSVHSSISLSHPEEQATGSKNHVIQPPKLFIGYPPAIFDMLKSDDDERIIVWGPDPAICDTIASSPTSMTADEQSKNKPSTPSIQGFSTNATATQNNGTASKRRSNLVNSARMSAQSLFSDGFSRLSRQKSLPTKMRPRLKHDDSSSSGRATPRLLKRASFTMKRNSAEELRSSLPPTPPSMPPQRVIEAASVEKLVEKLTNSLDYTLMTDFFLTYRAFISPLQLCKLLILRFRWALESDRDDRRVVRIRTFVVMRHWLLNYYVHDFVSCRELREILTVFLNALPQNALVQQSPRDQRIVRGLKRVVRSLKTVHYGPHPSPNHKLDPTLDKASWVESGATQSFPAMDGLRNSMLCDDNGSLDSELSPGNSDTTPVMEDVEPLFTPNLSQDDPEWSEEHAIAKLQYERRRREEEEERQRAEFFASYLADSMSDAPSSLQQDALSSTDSSDFIVTPMTSVVDNAKKVAPVSKRPQLPSEYIAAMTAAEALRTHSHQQEPLVRSRQYIPATIIHDMTTNEKTIRRIPSSKWCKATPEENPAFTSKAPSMHGGDEQQQQQQQAPPPLPSSDGLARRLSRKSIERRRSEKCLRDAAVASQGSSSVSSSAVSTPHLASADSNSNIVPELPPLPPATDLEAASAAAAILSSKLHNQQQQKEPNKRLIMSMSAGKQSFEALPYDTMASMPSESSPKQGVGARRRLSKKLAKIFKQQQQQEQPRATPPPKTAPKQEPPMFQECSSKTEVLVIPAPPLDSASHSSSSNVEVSTPTTPNSSRVPSSVVTAPPPSTTVGRIAAELRDDEEDIQTIELRRCSSTIENTEGYFKRPARGPIYLSHLVGAQPMGFESDAAVHIQELDDGDSSDDDDDDDEVATKKGLSRGMSILSTQPNHYRTMSLIVEPDRLAALTKEEEERGDREEDRPSSPTRAMSPPPAIKPLPADPPRQKSFILSYRSSKIAQQLCLIERQVLFGVEWEELVDCRWRDGIAASGGVQRLIQRFNSVCQWVASEIVTTELLHERVEVIRKFIRLAQKCKMYANFATLLQILLGLQSPAVTRLHSAWAQVGAADMRLLDQLSAFTSPHKNWKNIRDSMTKVAEEYGNRQQFIEQPLQQQQQQQQQQQPQQDDSEQGGGCIPFLGIYLSDLVFNSELPPYIAPVKSNGKATCDSLMLQQPLVNFHKHRITATVIKRVLTFQNLARRYPFTPEPELFRLCLDVKSVEPEKIRKLSLQLE
ncbi:hypothetical protein BJV82DRAFT_623945 [Fennellomyces sp. T-0311]|nr:hypothetical protein BJV82DRAFT_623945 [Fennellomyces sp. T-0311]